MRRNPEPLSKILVVDDTPANLKVITESLAAENYKTITAISGERALKRLETYLPDLILLDIQMPGIDGFETCRQIKANAATADIPIIFITALSDTESITKGFAIGAVDYISKPFREPELLARVKTHLQVRQLTTHLEHQVAERTAMWKAAAEEAQQSRLQLIQTEKMSSLGQMVAGIAHEINNPISFIQGNINPLRKYVSDLTALLETYEAEYPNPTETVLKKQEDIEIEFLIEDSTKILDSMKMGAQRVRDIVVSLRNFSRLDEATTKDVDLHEGLDSTLLILNHRIEGVTVTKSYNALPLVRCSPAQINQVFNNIITNALDAMFETDIPHKQLEITTRALSPEHVQVSIRDSGPGILHEVRSIIFDPLFTTKEVG